MEYKYGNLDTHTCNDFFCRLCLVKTAVYEPSMKLPYKQMLKIFKMARVLNAQQMGKGYEAFEDVQKCTCLGCQEGRPSPIKTEKFIYVPMSHFWTDVPLLIIHVWWCDNYVSGLYLKDLHMPGVIFCIYKIWGVPFYYFDFFLYPSYKLGVATHLDHVPAVTWAEKCAEAIWCCYHKYCNDCVEKLEDNLDIKRQKFRESVASDFLSMKLENLPNPNVATDACYPFF